ncbi:hypothetical protein MKX01_029819 [Papaver californicum]|nr:hypothetical protein MKX01_029819 [Papaver californicum]
MLYILLESGREKNIQIIYDEIFAGSTYGNNEVISMVEVLDPVHFDKRRFHIVCGLSQDLSLPGFRVGVIYFYSKNVLAAAKKLASFSLIFVPIDQHLLIPMLSYK